MSWDFDKPTSEKTNYTKFPQGISKIRILDAEPHVRWTHWMPQFQRSVNCPGRGCPIDDLRRQQKANGEPYTYSMTRRFAINIWNYETNQAEIMEQGIGFFQDLKDLMTDLRTDGHELSDAIIKVRRRGTGKDDTSYRVDLDSTAPMGDAERQAMENKPDLNEFFKPHTVSQILQLLAVTENHKDAWVEIMTGETPSASVDGDEGEEITVR